MSIINNEKLRHNYHKLGERLKSDGSAGLMHPYVSTRLIQDVSVECSFVQYEKNYTFHGDEAVERGGHERGPSPMRYFLSGIAFCMQGWYAKGCAVAGVDVESMRLDVRTFLDMRGEHGDEQSPVYPQWLIFDLRIESHAPKEKILEVVDWGNARCPLGVFAARAVPVYHQVTHNDAVVRDTRPEGIE